jgi:hypothetical protein
MWPHTHLLYITYLLITGAETTQILPAELTSIWDLYQSILECGFVFIAVDPDASLSGLPDDCSVEHNV